MNKEQMNKINNNINKNLVFLKHHSKFQLGIL